jgi:hypothetical protein
MKKKIYFLTISLLFVASFPYWPSGEENNIKITENIKPYLSRKLESGGWKIKQHKFREDQDMFVSGVKAKRYNDFANFTAARGSDTYEVQAFYSTTRKPQNRLYMATDRVNCLHGHYEAIEKVPEKLEENFKATIYYMQKNNKKDLLIFWLQSPAKNSATPLEHMLWQYWRDIIMQRNDAYFIKISPLKKLKISEEKLISFAKNIHSHMNTWLKEKVVVSK